MLTKEQIQRYHEITERVEAEAEARTEEMLDRLIAKRERLSQAGTPTTTMSQKNTLQDTSQTPSNGE